jgi:Flagellar biogenesis protein
MPSLFFGTWNFGLCTFAGRAARPVLFTSVTRWLLVVVGCAVLATAQPMSAASESANAAEPAPEKPASSDPVIFPRNSAERPAPAPAPSSSGPNVLVVLTALALAAAGVWVWVQRRQGIAIAARGQRKLQIEETRPLGGRQYLVVANYDGKKYLLGITPGRINLLTPLESSPEAPPSPAPEVKS